MIISHEDPESIEERSHLGPSFHNGAYYYSKDIVENIIPLVKTDRHWITIMVGKKCLDHSIYFIHNNLYPYKYNFIKNYKDVIVVSGTPETARRCRNLGYSFYLPLSVDVEYIKKFKTKKTKDVCYAGRRCKIYSNLVPKEVPRIGGIEHDELLKEIAKYRKVYAVGRTAIEAKILGCEVLPYDPRFPDPEVWQILDNKDAAKMLQTFIDEVEHGKHDHGRRACFHSSKK